MSFTAEIKMLVRNFTTVAISETDYVLIAEINPPMLFNSGVFVLEPSKRLFNYLMSVAPYLPSYDKTDQGLLNEVYMGAWHALPYTYNFLKVLSYLAQCSCASSMHLGHSWHAFLPDRGHAKVPE